MEERTLLDNKENSSTYQTKKSATSDNYGVLTGQFQPPISLIINININITATTPSHPRPPNNPQPTNARQEYIPILPYLMYSPRLMIHPPITDMDKEFLPADEML